MKRMRQGQLGNTIVSASAVAVSLGVALALTSALALASAAPTSTAPNPPDGAPVQFAPARGAVPFVGGTAADVVAALAQRLPLVANARISTKVIPAEAAGPPENSLVLGYDLRVPGLQGAAITEAIWQGNLLAGAVADEFAARDLGRLRGAFATLVAPDGRREPIGGGVGNVVRDQLFPNVSVDHVRATATSAGMRFGLRTIDVSLVRGLQDAVVIRAMTDTPTASVRALIAGGGLEAILGESPGHFEGAYLEVQDAQRRPLYITATAARAGVTTFWVNQGLGIKPRGRLEVPSA